MHTLKPSSGTNVPLPGPVGSPEAMTPVESTPKVPNPPRALISVQTTAEAPPFAPVWVVRVNVLHCSPMNTCGKNPLGDVSTSVLPEQKLGPKTKSATLNDTTILFTPVPGSRAMGVMVALRVTVPAKDPRLTRLRLDTAEPPLGTLSAAGEATMLKSRAGTVTESVEPPVTARL